MSTVPTCLSERRRVVAHGRVQGVFFRDSTRREAERRGVAGLGAQHAATGTVEAVFEGDADAVEAMVAFVRAGPGHSSVSDVEVHKEEPEHLSGFDVH